MWQVLRIMWHVCKGLCGICKGLCGKCKGLCGMWTDVANTYVRMWQGVKKGNEGGMWQVALRNYVASMYGLQRDYVA